MGNGEAVSLGNYPESPDSCGAASGSGGELDEVLLAPALGGFFAGCLVGEDGVENGPDGFGGSFEQGQDGLEEKAGEVGLGELPPFGLDADAVQLGDGEFDGEAKQGLFAAAPRASLILLSNEVESFEQDLFLVFAGRRGNEGEGFGMVGAGVEAVEGIGGILHLFPFQEDVSTGAGAKQGRRALCADSAIQS